MSDTNTTNPSKDLDPYFSTDYDSKERFCSYWHQFNEIIQLHPTRILEVGIGSGFLNRYLKQKGLTITTLDITHGLEPDVTGSVLEIPFVNESFDVVACYEVLEHLPYENFERGLRELFRITQKNVILSVPDASRVYSFYIELPRIKPIRKLIPDPFPRFIVHKYDGAHYWEIGKAGYPLEKIEHAIERSGFNIVKTYRVFELHYHRFFILKKAVI